MFFDNSRKLNNVEIPIFLFNDKIAWKINASISHEN